MRIRRSVGPIGSSEQAHGRAKPAHAGVAKAKIRDAESGRTEMGRAKRQARLRAVARDCAALAVLTLVVNETGVPLDELLGAKRGQAAQASARQLAMYLMNVSLRRIFADIGATFGRDRTTVSHACALIEDRRDDPAFDEMVAGLEAAITAAAVQPRLGYVAA